MRAHGFTLVELMITVAILAVIVGIGLPSFTGIVAQNRVTASINDFHAGLRLARSEAVKRNANVVFCASSNQTACTGGWGSGWLVYQDVDGDGTVDSGEIIRVGDAVQTGYTLTFTSATSAITFAARGMTSGQSGTFKLCDKDKKASYARGIILLVTGATRRSIDANKSGVHEDSGGNDFSC